MLHSGYNLNRYASRGVIWKTALLDLREATIQDADLLLEWRNDPETRNASHNTGEVQREDHISWLTKTGKRRKSAAIRCGREWGSMEPFVQIFPMVFMSCRGRLRQMQESRGVAKRMVALLASQISEPIRAEVKSGNTASIRVAEHAGMQFVRQADGVLHYRRATLK